jgi:hypothetical protein
LPGGVSQQATSNPPHAVLESEILLYCETSENPPTPMLLHAWKLAFVHPLSGTLVEFTSDRINLE